MNNFTKFFIPTLIAITLLISMVSALPTTGAFTGVTNNQANTSCTGVTGTAAWAGWGQTPDGQVWRTENFTATAGTAVVRIWGAPLMSNTLYYAKCCDDVGCDATAESFTTLPATVIAQTTFSQGWSNLTQSRFNIMYIVPAILGGFTNVVPAVVFFGLTLCFIVLGFWRANRTVRLVSIVFLIVGGYFMVANTGLEFGMPGVIQNLGIAFLAAGLAGIAISFVHR